MPGLRTAAAVAAAALTAAACGGTAPVTTVDARRSAAEEYAVTARRALEGTRFEGSADADVAGWVIDVCDGLPASAGPEAAVDGVIGSIDAPGGPDVDDRIIAVVLAEGAIAVCPDEVDSALRREWESASAETRFLGAVAAVSPVTEREFPAEELLAAGRLVCDTLDGGAGAEAALLAELEALFGVSGPLEEVSADEIGDREGMVAGGVLGAASSILCPEHRSTVDEYLDGLARQD